MSSAVTVDDAASPHPRRRKFGIIVAATSSKMGIGNNGQLPWRHRSLPGDMAYFKRISMRVSDDGKQNAVIMGRKTWESIPAKFRPLSQRVNIILSSQQQQQQPEQTRQHLLGIITEQQQQTNDDDEQQTTNSQRVIVVASLDAALQLLATSPFVDSVENVYIIGGARVYKEAMSMQQCETIHMTRVDYDFECDTFIDDVDMQLYAEDQSHSEYNQEYVDDGIKYTIHVYRRRRCRHHHLHTQQQSLSSSPMSSSSAAACCSLSMEPPAAVAANRIEFYAVANGDDLQPLVNLTKLDNLLLSNCMHT